MLNFQILNDMILVKLEREAPDFQVELLKVKRLPGRAYDSELEAWGVPILPGLGRALEDVYGPAGAQVAALIEEREGTFLARLEVPGPVDPFKMGLVEAVNIALTFHLYAAHKGSKSDYNRVHYPLIFGE